LERLREAVAGAWDRAIKGDPVVLVCAPALRRPLSRVLASAGVDLPVLAYRELPVHVTITATEVIGGV
jgi:flagellar biosynthesis component FlhA